MSHVTTISALMTDLSSLRAAAVSCGLEFVEGQKTFKWYGSHVGDFPIPAGFTVEDMGKCDHVIRVPGNTGAYEIGVCRRRDGKPGYTLMFDFWGSCGAALEKLAGKRCADLVQQYGVQVIKKTAGMTWKVTPQKMPNGTLRVVLS